MVRRDGQDHQEKGAARRFHEFQSGLEQSTVVDAPVQPPVKGRAAHVVLVQHPAVGLFDGQVQPLEVRAVLVGTGFVGVLDNPVMNEVGVRRLVAGAGDTLSSVQMVCRGQNAQPQLVVELPVTAYLSGHIGGHLPCFSL